MNVAFFVLTTYIMFCVTVLKPTFATSVCGNNVCEYSENSFGCPVDCANKLILGSTSGGSGAVSSMFQVKALRDVIVRSIAFHAAKAATAQVQIFTLAGPYRGFEGNESAWTLIYDKVTSMNDRNTPTKIDSLDTSIFISADATQSFYIFTPNKLMYASGTTEGARFSSDSAMALYEGLGMISKFSSNPSEIYSPRVFRGSIV